MDATHKKRAFVFKKYGYCNVVSRETMQKKQLLSSGCPEAVFVGVKRPGAKEKSKSPLIRAFVSRETIKLGEKTGY